MASFGVFASDQGAIDPGRINARLVREGIEVRELRSERTSLESVFLSLTKGQGQPSPDDTAPGVPAETRDKEVLHA